VTDIPGPLFKTEGKGREGIHPFDFLYLFCHDFRKINGRIKIFEKCTSSVDYAAAPHGVKSLPPWGTAARACRRAARQEVHAVPLGVFFIFFSFSFSKHF
jgi:hypothetical protein